MKEILFIEDREQDVEIIKDLLYLHAPYSFRLHNAQSLQEGINIIRWNKEVDVVLLDLGLVDVTGPRSIRQLFEAIPDKPVIILTGNSNENLRIQAINTGAQDFLVKGTFDGPQLVRAIQQAKLRFKHQADLRTRLWGADRTIASLHQLFDLNNIGGWEMDMLENTMLWQPKLYQMLGQSTESLPQPTLQSYLDSVVTEDKELVTSFFKNLQNQSLSYEQEAIVKHRSIISGNTIKYFCLRGKVQPLESSGGMKLVGSIQDITPLERTKEVPLNETADNAIIPDVIVNSIQDLQKQITSLLQIYKHVEEQLSLKQATVRDHLQQTIADLTTSIFRQVNICAITSQKINPKEAVVTLTKWQAFFEDILRAKAFARSVKWHVELSDMMPNQIITDATCLSLLIYNLADHILSLCQPEDQIDIQILMLQKEHQPALGIQISTPNNPTLQEKLSEFSVKILESLARPNYTLTDRDSCLNIMVITKVLTVLGGSIRISELNALEISLPYLPYLPKENQFQNPKALLVIHKSIINFSVKQKMRELFANVELHFAQSIKEATQKMNTEVYVCVLIDVETPSGNGFLHSQEEVINRMNATKNNAPIIALLDNKKDAQKSFLQEGAYACLSNPPRLEELEEVITPLL